MTQSVTKKLMLYFPKCECEAPIIYHLVKTHNLVVNIYRAKVTPEDEGYLVLDVTGTPTNIQAGLEYVQSFNVSINESGKGVTRDKEKCTHCGHCLTHCRPKALSIGNNKTREVSYDQSICIECLACIKVCPYDACASAF